MASVSRETILPDLLACTRQAAGRTLRAFARDDSLPFLALVDATCGNGHDTLFLATSLAKISRKAFGIFAFDVQEAALAATRDKLLTHGCQDACSLLLQSHAGLEDALSRPERFPPSLAREAGTAQRPLPIVLALYNLGFLPRNGKGLVTQADTTLASLRSAAALLLPGGLLAVHAYAGHPGGREELDAVEAFTAALPFEEWRAARYSLCNKRRNPEALFLLEKRRRHE